jgi:hypothetical protein
MYRGAAGRVVLYLGNKTEHQPIEGLSVPISPIQGLRLDVNTPLPPSLAPKQQVQLVLDVSCESPYLKSPILQLAYHLPGSATRVRQVRGTAPRPLRELACHALRGVIVGRGTSVESALSGTNREPRSQNLDLDVVGA